MKGHEIYLSHLNPCFNLSHITVRESIDFILQTGASADVVKDIN